MNFNNINYKKIENYHNNHNVRFRKIIKIGTSLTKSIQDEINQKTEPYINLNLKIDEELVNKNKFNTIETKKEEKYTASTKNQ